MRIKVPTPPRVGKGTHALESNGLYVCHIWAFDPEGARIIETQYKTAQGIMQARSVSRATAYRIIKAHPKRYWYINLHDTDTPRVRAVLPLAAVEAARVYPVGNPNLHNGIYQQAIARRPRKR